MQNFKKYAWYFPNWHVTPLNEKLHGKDWTEWECVKYATPRFEGHLQPKRPLWGYEDESDPKVFEKKIDAALSHGFDGFLFDYYWFKETGAYRIDGLEKGFLGAANSGKCEFAVVWCNHDPIYVHPAAYRHDSPEILSGDMDEELFVEVTDYCIKNYFPLTNYRRVDGKVYFGLWDTSKMLKNFGGEDETARIFADFRARAAKAGFDVHLAVHRPAIPQYKNDWNVCNALIKKLGIDSVFSYCWSMPPTEDWPKIEYDTYRKINRAEYEQITEKFDVPMDITVLTGWDCSPRTVQSDKYEDVGYPFSPIVVGNDAAAVKRSFEDAKDFIDSGKFTGNMLTVSCWNEWTEGSYMEPDEDNGYGYLEAFRDVFGK